MDDLELLQLEMERRRRAALAPSGPPQPAPATPAATPAAPAAPEASASAQRWGGGKAGKALAGLGDSGIKAYLGLKQLAFGSLDEEDQNVLKMMSQDAAEDGLGMRNVGELAGNVASMAVPGAAVTRAARGTNLVRSLATAAPRTAAIAVPTATNAALSGVQEATMTPNAGGELDLGQRAKQGGVAAGTSLALSTAGAAARKGTTGLFRPSAEAQTLMAEGVIPKLQEGAEGGMGRFIGRLTKGAIDPGGDRESQEAIQAIARRLIPGQDVSKYSPSDLVEAVSAKLKGEYDGILGGKKFTFSVADQDAVRRAARRAAGGRADTLNIVNSEIESIIGRTRNPRNFKHGSQPTEGLSRQREKFQDRIDELLGPNASVQERDAGRALMAAKGQFDKLVRNSKLSPEELDRLNANDKSWAAFLPIKNAANSAQGSRQLDVSRIIDKSRKGDNIARGDYPNADILEPANRMFAHGGEEGRRFMVGLNRALGLSKVAIGGGATLATSSTPAAAVLAPAYGLSLLGQTRSGARALFGDYDWQKELAKRLRKGGEYSAGMGAGAYQPSIEEEE